MKKIGMFTILLIITSLISPSRIIISACPSSNHPMMAVQGENFSTILNNPNSYPGISKFVVSSDKTAEQISIAHNNNITVIGAVGAWSVEMNNPKFQIANMSDIAYRGYDVIIVDEAVDWNKNYWGYSNLDMAAQHAVEVFNPAFREAKEINPKIKVGIVEHYRDYLWAFMRAGGKPDFVSGEDYTDEWGDIRQADLDLLKSTYAVQTQQWVIGVDKIMQYNGRVDLIIAADVRGNWGNHFRAFKYSDALKRRLDQSCKMFLPVVTK